MAKKQLVQQANPVKDIKQELKQTIETLTSKQEEGRKIARSHKTKLNKWQDAVEYAEEMLGYAVGNEEAEQALNILLAQAKEFSEAISAACQQVNEHNEEIDKVIGDCRQKLVDLDLMEKKNSLHQSLREIASTLQTPIELSTQMPEFREAEKLVFTAQALIDIKDEKL